MSTVINTNVQALNSQRSLKIVGNIGSKASEKLSSGQRINRAGDDAAGLAISEKMRNQIKGLNQASRNSQDGISLIQTAEGALQETHEMLKRMRELVVQAANDTNEAEDRQQIQLEIEELIKEIDATADKTEFNKKKLINGSAADIHLQVGANQNQKISFSISAMTASALSLGTSMNSAAPSYSITVTNSGQIGVGGIATETDAGIGSAIMSKVSTIDAAISKVSSQRAKLGAIQNRLEHTIKNLDTASENLSAAESRIRDTDMAQEMMNFTKANVLQQAATNMLAQANQAPNNVLSLLG